MEKPISRAAHGFADYTYIPTVAVIPRLAGFENETTAANLCRIMSGGVLASTLLTRAEWGAVPVIPFKAHLAADVSLGFLSMGAPWLFGFAKNNRARNTFLVLGAISVLAGLLTRPDEMKVMSSR